MEKFAVLEVESGSVNTESILGTVREALIAKFGDKGQLTPSSARNANDPTKRLSMKLHNGTGEFVRMNCSRKLSEMVRSKEVTIADLLDCRIQETVIGEKFENAGETIYQIIMPDAEAVDAPEFHVGVKAVSKPFKVEAPSLAELLAFS